MLFNYILSFFDNKGRYIFQLCKFLLKFFLSYPTATLLNVAPTLKHSSASREIAFSLFADANIYTFHYFAKHNTVFFIIFFYADIYFY